MKCIEQFFRTEFGNSWLMHKASTTFTGRVKSSEGVVLAREIRWTEHPVFFNFFGREHLSWVPVEELREVDIV